KKRISMDVQAAFAVLLMFAATVNADGACDNCFELDAFLFIGMVTADVIVSTVLMIIIYRCNRKTSSDAPPYTPVTVYYPPPPPPPPPPYAHNSK
uniref:Hematopoietic cell signal transducer n=1 Tax=Nothobranchius furzeri TaxID=105023 RepID=A0A8C6MB68_NOTFU